jgi:hypothetical protein
MQGSQWIEFYYSGVYFLNVMKVDVTDKIISQSNYAPLILSNADAATLPGAQNFRLSNAVSSTAGRYGAERDEASFTAEWFAPVGSVKNDFLGRRYPGYPYGEITVKDENLTYNLYVSHSQSDVRNIGSQNYNESRPFSLPSSYRIVTVDYNAVSKARGGDGVMTLFFSAINGNSGTAVNGRSLRDWLRSNYTVCITNIPLDVMNRTFVTADDVQAMAVRLDGMDKNQRYFAAADAAFSATVTFPRDERQGRPEPITETAFARSDYSNISGIVTPGDRTTPRPDEFMPGSPRPFTDMSQITSTTGEIFWEKLPPFADEEGRLSQVEYEIIKLQMTNWQNDALQELLLHRTMTMDEIWLELEKIEQAQRVSFSKEAFRTNLRALEPAYAAVNPRPPFTYDALRTPSAGFTDRFDDFDLTIPDEYAAAGNDPRFAEYEVSQTGRMTGEVRFRDNTLRPNTTYFYLVRAVHLIYATNAAGAIFVANELYSNWGVTAVTSRVVERPENLRVLRTGVEYDPMTEAWIEFDAPLRNPFQQLGVDYDFYYQLRENDGAFGEPVRMPRSALLANNPVPTPQRDGWYRFRFKITGLKAGNNYTIQVRMTDAQGDSSMWSNPAVARTDPDQDAYDREKEKDDWIDFLQKELAPLLRSPVWTLQDSSSRLSVFYRPSMFTSVMLAPPGAEIKLAAPTRGANSFSYYFPSDVIDEIVKNNKSLTIEGRNNSVTLTRGSLDFAYDTVMIGVKNDINAKRFADYYVRVNVNFTAANNLKIEDNNVIGDRADVTAVVVPVSGKMDLWDGEMLELYIEQIALASLDGELHDRFVNLIGANASNHDLLALVNSIYLREQAEMERKISASLEKISAPVRALTNFARPIAVSVNMPADNAVVQGYSLRNNTWQTEQVVDMFANRKTIMTNRAGSYVFTGYTAVMNGFDTITGIGDGTAVSAIIARYGLDDYLGKGMAFMPDSPASLGSVMGIIARLAGMPRNADPAVYLRGRGYEITGRTTANVRNDEAIHLMMMLYEMKTGTKVSTIRIRDFSLTAGITGIDPRYLQSVRAAYEIGLCDDEFLRPRDAAATADIVRLIHRLNRIVRL